jgi:hypothetical protein
MADVPTTTTTLTELVNSETINPAIMSYAYEYVVAAPYVRKMDLRGTASNVGSFPRWVKDAATDLTAETTTLDAVALETTDVQITGAEIGVRRNVTDAVLEMTIIGTQIFDFLVRDTGILFGISLDDDICALFATLNGGTAVGTSGADLTLANMVEAQSTIRKNGARGSLVYILDDQQAEDLQKAQAASTATTVNSFFEVAHGIDSGYLGTYMGAPVWNSGLTDTANTGANVVGACFVDGEANPEFAAISMVLSRDVRTELQREAAWRRTDFVGTAKWGVGETADTSGVPIVTDA